MAASLTKPMFDEAHEVGQQVVIACSDTAELLEFAEEALDDVALLVEVNVIHDFGSRFSDLCMQLVGVIALVGDRGASLEAIDKIMGKGDVVALSGAGDQADR